MGVDATCHAETDSVVAAFDLVEVLAARQSDIFGEPVDRHALFGKYALDSFPIDVHPFFLHGKALMCLGQYPDHMFVPVFQHGCNHFVVRLDFENVELAHELHQVYFIHDPNVLQQHVELMEMFLKQLHVGPEHGGAIRLDRHRRQVEPLAVNIIEEMERQLQQNALFVRLVKCGESPALGLAAGNGQQPEVEKPRRQFVGLDPTIKAVDETFGFVEQFVEKRRIDLRKRMGKCSVEAHELWIYGTIVIIGWLETKDAVRTIDEGSIQAVPATGFGFSEPQSSAVSEAVS